MSRNVGKTLHVLVRTDQLIFQPLTLCYVLNCKKHQLGMIACSPEFARVKQHDSSAKRRKIVDNLEISKAGFCPEDLLKESP